MNFLEKALDYLGIKTGQAVRTWSEVSMIPEDKYWDYTSYKWAIKQIPWVYACAHVRASAIASVKWYILDQNNEEIFGEVRDRLMYPNEFYDWHDLIYLTSLYMDLTGNAFWDLDEVNGYGQPAGIFLLDSACM